MKRIVLAGVTLALFAPLLSTSRAATVTTPQIVAGTVSATFACMRYTPVGICFWLSCSWTGCSVDTALKVGHYNPDLVVSVYNELGRNPWVEIRATLGLAQQAIAHGVLGALTPLPIDSAGNRTEGGHNRNEHRNLVFRETDAIGHPVDSLSAVLGGAALVCESETSSFVPYFQSALDAFAWRQEIPEILYPASWVPGLREVGDWPLQTWGSVHPRTGWTTQAEEPKAAALNAQRAADIVTRSGQPHIYRPVGTIGARGQRVWSPGPLMEADARSGAWQMLSPRSEVGCRAFGSNDLVGLSSWSAGRVDPGGDYVWNLWRPYQCCRRRGQWFLFDINWSTYPP